MESIDLTFKLVDLKIKVKHLTKCTIRLKYFKNIAIVMTKGEKRKSKLGKFIYFCCHPFPLRTFLMARVKIRRKATN